MYSSSQVYRPQEERNRALRLTFAYRGERVELASRQHVDMMAPPSDRTDEYEGQSGFWVEVRDPEGRVLYRRVMHNPLQPAREAPSGDPQRPFTHVKAEAPEGTFVVVVPEIEQGRIVALFGSPPDAPGERAMQITRVDLQEQPPRDTKETE